MDDTIVSIVVLIIFISLVLSFRVFNHSDSTYKHSCKECFVIFHTSYQPLLDSNCDYMVNGLKLCSKKVIFYTVFINVIKYYRSTSFNKLDSTFLRPTDLSEIYKACN